MDITNVAFKDIGNEDYQEQDQSQEKEFSEVRGEKTIWDILKIKTGSGGINDYIDNPLNIDKSESTAQILRGITGFAGDLDLFWIDILMGLFNKIKPTKKEVVTNE